MNDMAPWMRDVERRLDALSGGNQVSNGTVTDPETGHVVSLQQLAFGTRSASDPGSWVANNANHGATFYGGGPDLLRVRVRSDRLIVIHSAGVQAAGAAASTSFSSRIQPSLSLDGGAGVGPTVLPSQAAALQCSDTSSNSQGARLQASYWRLVTGLEPGFYDVLSAYNLSCQSGALGYGYATARSLIVIPF